MGFLEVGTALSWEQSGSVREYVKHHGLEQFLYLWNKNKYRSDTELKWGEEVEYSLVEIDSQSKLSRVFADAAAIIEKLNTLEEDDVPSGPSAEWHPEFSNHMIECIPLPPYPLTLDSITMIEPSMCSRRSKIQSTLPSPKFVISQTAFPRFGLDDFVTPPAEVDSAHSMSRSVFVPDQLINPHPRFGALVNNIRSRRGAKPFITIPICEDADTYKDESSWSLAREKSVLNRFEVEQLALETINPVKGEIYMDGFAFGMGMSCVQTTFGTTDCSSARHLYDQLAVLAPLFLALTASTPFLRGFLADSDTRWPTLEQAVDCRTEEEMGTIPKSRYSGVSLYISDRPRLTEHLSELNDTNAPINEKAKALLIDAGVDDILAEHFGHLWIRDPIVIFKEKVELDDSKVTDHFENIQSTNWNSLRFKPPPPSSTDGPMSSIGWRVEFRTPEIQLTDYDNAAGVALISVISQMVSSKDIDFYIPMSLNDVNMHRAWNKNAARDEKFWFRKDVSNGNFDVHEMTLHEILTGCAAAGFEGLIPMCKSFMDSECTAGRCGEEARTKFSQYCALLAQRSSGKLMTCAQYLRNFVMSHPAYKDDSVVSPVITHDLSVLSANIGFGIWTAPELHGEFSKFICRMPLSTLVPQFSPFIPNPIDCCKSWKSCSCSAQLCSYSSEKLVDETSVSEENASSIKPLVLKRFKSKGPSIEFSYEVCGDFVAGQSESTGCDSEFSPSDSIPISPNGESPVACSYIGILI